MRIGICGAHGVGKTTLLNALRSEPILKKHTVCDEITRKVKKMGFEINEGGNDLTQLFIMNQHIANLFLHVNLITDRTALDGYVYTSYLYDQGKVSESTYQYAYTVYRECWPHYDIVFYIKPEFELKGDNVRSENKEFQTSIANLFEKTIKLKIVKLTPILLTGSLRNRLEIALSYINKAFNHDYSYSGNVTNCTP